GRAAPAGPGRASSDARREAVAERGADEPEGERPELVDRRLEARAPLLRAPQTLGPHVRVHAVVDLLAVDLCGQAGERRPSGRGGRLDPEGVRLLVEPAAGNRPLPLGKAKLDERGAAVGVGLAIEGEL